LENQAEVSGTEGQVKTSLEDLALDMVSKINNMVSKCTIDMKILTKSDEKFEMLRN